LAKVLASNQKLNQNAVPERTQASEGWSEAGSGPQEGDFSGSHRPDGPGMGGITGLVEQMAQDVVGQSGDIEALQSPIGDGVHEGSSEVCSEQVQAERSTGAIQSDRPVNGAASSNGEHSGPSLAEQLKLLRDPVTFTETFCRDEGDFPSTEWQFDFRKDYRVVNDEGQIDQSQFPRNIALVAVNGAGKTKEIAKAIRYLLSTVPQCIIPITSSVYRQLEMLETYLKAQNHKFPGWTCVEGKLTAPNGNYARWFATDTVGAVESFHAPFLVRILDEVKSMQDEIIDATNRWQPKLTIFISSKGLAQGRLYEALTVNRQHWRVHEVSATMCPWISQKWIDQQIAEHGKDSPLIKSMILNEFSDVDIRNLISLEALNKLIANPPMHRHSKTIVAGVDPSAAKKGGDEFAIYYRQGNKVFPPIIISGYSSPLEAVGQSIYKLKEIGASIINIDKGNTGQLIAPMYEEQLKGDRSLIVNAVDFGGKSQDTNGKFADRATEIWYNMAKKIERREIILPKDDKTIAQLTTREYVPQSSGSIKLISKDVMRRRGQRSPDRGDALALCLIDEPVIVPLKTIEQEESSWEQSMGRLYNNGRVHTVDGGFDLGN